MLTVLLGIAALAVAIGSERYGGLVPCALCLLERWPYRVAILAGVFAWFAPRRPARMALAFGVLCFLAAAGLATVHVGVEQGAWKSPLPECAAPGFDAAQSVQQRLASMPARPAKPCDDPTYLLPGLPVSMAMLNLAYALASGAIVAMSLARSRGRRP